MPLSPQVRQIQPKDGSGGRLERQAAHCSARGSFSRVQAIHDHSVLEADGRGVPALGLGYGAELPLEDDALEASGCLRLPVPDGVDALGREIAIFEGPETKF